MVRKVFLLTNFLVPELESSAPQMSYGPSDRSPTVSIQFTSTQPPHIDLSIPFRAFLYIVFAITQTVPRLLFQYIKCL